MYFIIGWLAYLDSEALGAESATDHGEEDNTYNGFGDHDNEESGKVGGDQAEGVDAAAGPA